VPGSGAAWAQGGAAAEAEASVVREARAFMAAYARELAAGDRPAIAARYDRRGSWVMGGGAKRYSSHAQTAAYYAGPNWSPPAAFEWRDLSYEPLGPDAVAVVGTFLWTRAAGQPPVTVAYTGLLVRQDGALRIRIEDEDAASEPSQP
jgi:hypothetical protein